jgi:hypothetical protein
MTSNTQTSCDACVKDFHGEASNHAPILCNVCSERMPVFGILLHHPPFYPAQKNESNLAVQVEQFTMRV